jgi:predicted neuraminidase
LETGKNKILSAWFGGTREGNKDVCIYLAEKDKKGNGAFPKRLQTALSTIRCKTLAGIRFFIKKQMAILFCSIKSASPQMVGNV